MKVEVGRQCPDASLLQLRDTVLEDSFGLLSMSIWGRLLDRVRNGVVSAAFVGQRIIDQINQ
jgi:hypothetical protein